MLTHAMRVPLGQLEERAIFTDVVEDAAEAVVVGAGHNRYAIDTGIARDLITVVVTVEVPWWRRLWFDASALELRIVRMLLLLSTPDGRVREYEVEVRVGLVA